MKLECIVPPAKEPLTVAEAREYLRIDDDIEDSLTESFIIAARMYCENYQKQAYYTQTLRLTVYADEVPGYDIELPRSKHLQKVNSVKFKGVDGEIDCDDYSVHCGDVYSCVELYGLPDGDIIIEYVTGEDEPQIEDVKAAIKILIGGLHGNRQPFIEEGRNEVNKRCAVHRRRCFTFQEAGLFLRQQYNNI